MPQLTTDADTYAAQRQNIFFTANGETPVDGNLTGQCVTLVKWFLAETTEVPAPFSARGDARWVGKRLVAQGHADEVAYADRQEGDIICYEYGTYGHIAVQLSGGRVFESNVNLGGVARRLVDGVYVYASRIGSEAEAWRRDVHVYRIKSYNGGDMQKPVPSEVTTCFEAYLQVAPTDAQMQYYLARDIRELYGDVLQSTRPGIEEVNQAFNDLQGSAPSAGQKGYYPNYGKSVLYKDLGYGVKREYEEYKKTHTGTGDQYVETKVYVKKEK